MFVQWIHFYSAILLLSMTWELCADENSLEPRTKFFFYDEKNEPIFESTSRFDKLTSNATGCDPFDKYAIIVHGYNETCDESWVKKLRKNLINHRGGCIICMDYGEYDADWVFIVDHFKEISDILTAKLIALRDNFFSSCTAYLFGFSFGARIVAQATMDFGYQQIEKIHLCEPAGPSFPSYTNADPKLGAMEAQCIHTAAGRLGTNERNCHQDWLMGDCGELQKAGSHRLFPNDSHGLCPQFYNFAFKYHFPAVKKHKTCIEPTYSRDAKKWPHNGYIRMGYFQRIDAFDRKLNEKNFYAITTRHEPFTPYHPDRLK